MSELAVKTTRSLLWSITENLSLQLTQFLVSIVLARLLLPEQFGIIGMLSLFMAVAQSLLDSGFGSALLQKKDANQIDMSSVFYFNLGIGIVLTALLWCLAPWIADFFSEPLLVPLTFLMALNITINAFGLVPVTLLVKRMDFRRLLVINLIAVAAGGVAGILAALAGLGVWSLVIQSMFTALLKTAVAWLASRWAPSLICSISALKTMFGFGSRLLISGLLDTFFQNIYTLFIGKLYSATDLGFFVRAQSMQAMAVQPASSALSRVMLPALAPLQDNEVKLKQAYRKTMTTAVFFHFPLIIGLIVVAEPLIRLLMTERWAPSAPFFQLLCIIGLFWPLHVLNLNVLIVTGRSDLFLRLEIIKRVLVVISIALTYRWGIYALIGGQIVVSLVGYYLNSLYSGELIGYPMREQIGDFYVYLLTAIAMGICMYLVGDTLTSDLFQVLAKSTVGLVVYLGFSYIVSRPILVELVRLTRHMVQA